jgi:hypothetical protein
MIQALADGRDPETSAIARRERRVRRDGYARALRPDERAVLECTIRRITDKPRSKTRSSTRRWVASLDGSDLIVVSTKMLRAELLSVKADLERELEREVLDCSSAGRRRITSVARRSGRS